MSWERQGRVVELMGGIGWRAGTGDGSDETRIPEIPGSLVTKSEHTQEIHRPRIGVPEMGMDARRLRLSTTGAGRALFGNRNKELLIRIFHKNGA
jgi:hypothetical protein